MPTYQYACTVCDERLEVVQKFSDDPLTICTACGGRLRKLFSAVGIVFKGSGFYRTDSRSGAVPAGARDSQSNGSAPSASSEGASGGGEGKTSGEAKASGEAKTSAEAKPAKPETAGSGKSSPAGTKVA